MSKNRLPDHMLGQFKNPEVQAKATAAKKAKAANRKAILEEAYSMSKISDPENQAKLIDKMFDMAMNGDAKALTFLQQSGLIRVSVPTEKIEPEKEVEIAPEDAIKALQAKMRDKKDD